MLFVYYIYYMVLLNNQFEGCSIIYKVIIFFVFLDRVVEGNDICRMCYSGIFREYKIIICNYGNFSKGNYFNLFLLRSRIVLFIVFEFFQEINVVCFYYFEWILQFFIILEIIFLIYVFV